MDPDFRLAEKFAREVQRPGVISFANAAEIPDVHTIQNTIAEQKGILANSLATFVGPASAEKVNGITIPVSLGRGDLPSEVELDVTQLARAVGMESSLVDAKLRPFDSAFLVHADVDLDVRGRIIVEPLNAWESPGEKGYRVDHEIATSFSMTDGPLSPAPGDRLKLQAEVLGGLFGNEKYLDANINNYRHVMTVPGEALSVPADTVKVIRSSFNPVDNNIPLPADVSAPQRATEQGPDVNRNTSLFDADISVKGEFSKQVDVGVEITHVVKVPAEDVEAVRQALEGQAYKGHFDIALTAYNPGTSGAEKGLGDGAHFFTNVRLETISAEASLDRVINLADLEDAVKETRAEKRAIAEENKTDSRMIEDAAQPPPPRQKPALPEEVKERMMAEEMPVSRRESVFEYNNVFGVRNGEGGVAQFDYAGSSVIDAARILGEAEGPMTVRGGLEKIEEWRQGNAFATEEDAFTIEEILAKNGLEGSEPVRGEQDMAKILEMSVQKAHGDLFAAQLEQKGIYGFAADFVFVREPPVPPSPASEPLPG